MSQKKQPFSSLTLLAIDAALQAGELLRRGFGTHFSISSKEGKHNLVTEYDHRSEKLILDLLGQGAPSSRFFAEESGKTGAEDAELLWIIDPLDGTVNYAHQIPVFAVSIGLQKEGKVVSGVIYQPMTHELFATEKGKGAFLNGEPIHTSATARLAGAILATGFPYNLAENPFHCIEHFIDLLKIGTPIRRLGAAAIDLAYTAAGRFEGFFEATLAPWDCAAGNLLLEEAGGKVSHWDGKPFDLYSYQPILASNGLIHEEVVAILKRSS